MNPAKAPHAYCAHWQDQRECVPFTAIFRQSVIPMLLLDPQSGQIVDANPAAIDFYGYSDEDLRTMSISDINILSAEEVQAEMSAAAQRQQAFFSFRHRIAGGEIRDVEVSSGPVEINERSLLYSLVRDVTRRNQAEEALARKNRALQAFGKCSSAIIHGTNERLILEAVCRTLVIEVGYVLSWIGYALNDSDKRIETQASYGSDLLSLEQATYSWDATSSYGMGPCGKAIRSGRTEMVVDTEVDPDFVPWREQAAKKGVRSVLAIPLKTGVRVYGVLLIGGQEPKSFDAEAIELLNQMGENLSFGISSIRAHERQQRLEQRLMWEKNDLLKAQQDLEDAHDYLKTTQAQMVAQEKLASVGQLAAGVAHEINNPTGFIASNLNSLNKYAERLFRYIDAQDELLQATATPEQLTELTELRKELKVRFLREDLTDLVAESLDGTERISGIVKNLKTFARTDSEAVASADLNECLNSTINIAWNEIKYKAELVRELGELPPVRCNAQKINQVFMNLLINAAHAIKEKGTIWVRTRAEDSRVVVEVEDSGCGIPDEIQQKIFEPFFTTKEVGKGTGLGMSIAADIVKKHRGQLSVSSKVGVGTCFTLTLPIGEEG